MADTGFLKVRIAMQCPKCWSTVESKHLSLPVANQDSTTHFFGLNRSNPRNFTPYCTSFTNVHSAATARYCNGLAEMGGKFGHVSKIYQSRGSWK